jgi:putative aminopeptidase
MNLTRLEKLSAITAPSGHEDPMIAVMREEMQRVTEDVQIDRLGNVIARLPATDPTGGKPVMVFAHMDELGFIVRRIEPDGFLRLERLGGIPERTAPARPVMVKTPAGYLMGVIGHKSHHFTQPDEKYAVIKIHDLYVDLGVRTRQAVLGLGVEVGAPVTYAQFFLARDDTVFAKSLDNRGGCEILLEALEGLAALRRERDIYFVSTVQEEFNLRGVLTSLPLIAPEIAVCIDVVVACDTPDLSDVSDTRLGGGPAISKYTFHGRGTLGGLIPNPRLVSYFRSSADNNGIPYQLNVSMGLLTDASFLQVKGEGVHCIDIGFPARYTHAPVESASIMDMSNTVELIVKALSKLPADLDLRRGFA